MATLNYHDGRASRPRSRVLGATAVAFALTAVAIQIILLIAFGFGVRSVMSDYWLVRIEIAVFALPIAGFLLGLVGTKLRHSDQNLATLAVIVSFFALLFLFGLLLGIAAH
jgi:hypothetical protein